MTKNDERKEIYISNEVLDKFIREINAFGGDDYQLMRVYGAMKKRNGEDIVMMYESADVSKYARYLIQNGLADTELDFDFSLPINYFKLLLSKCTADRDTKTYVRRA